MLSFTNHGTAAGVVVIIVRLLESLEAFRLTSMQRPLMQRLGVHIVKNVLSVSPIVIDAFLHQNEVREGARSAAWLSRITLSPTGS